MQIPHRPALGTRVQIRRDRVFAHRRECIEHRAVHLAAFASPFSLDDRDRNTKRGIEPADEVRNGRPGLRRLAVGRPRQTHKTAHRLNDPVIGSALPVRPRLAEAGNGRVDDVRPDRLDRLIRKPEPVHDAGAVIFDQNIACFQKLFRKLQSLRVLEIQDHALFVPVVAPIGGGRSVKARPESARHVCLRAFDVNDLCAEIGQLRGTERAGGRRRHIEYPIPRQRSVHPGTSFQTLAFFRVFCIMSIIRETYRFSTKRAF